MSETIGYPNTNYDPHSIETKSFDVHTYITLEDNEYRELVAKAAAMDILTAQIRTTGEINETVVRAITGTLEAKELVPKSEADSYFGWYVEKRKVCEEQSKKIAALEHANVELRELLRQNNIGAVQNEKKEEF